MAALAALLTVAALALPALAQAETPPAEFAQFPEAPAAGTAANQLDTPNSVAADPTTGHVFVAEAFNERISEFTPWGEFVKAWGWGVRDGSPELQTCTQATGCQAGQNGSAAGQFWRPRGVAVDSASGIYVLDEMNNRVQKFDASGAFVLMLGGEVNKTTSGNVCTAASGNECGVGVAGGAAGWFDWPKVSESGGEVSLRSPIAIGPGDSVFVGDLGRVQEFGSGGSLSSSVSIAPNRTPTAVAVDPTNGDLWIGLNKETTAGFEPRPIYKLEAGTGTVLEEVDIGDPNEEPSPITAEPFGLATDSAGNVYASAWMSKLGEASWFSVVKLSPNGDCLICAVQRFEEVPANNAAGKPQALATSTACGVTADSLYVTHYGTVFTPSSGAQIRAFGATPDPTICPPPAVPPSITAQYAVSANTGEAQVRARINPRFWSDTEFQVEYGEDECSEGSCTALPFQALGGKPVSFPVTTPAVLIPNLKPNTKYYFRFVAQSSGGGPVKGVGGEVGVDGSEGTFLTRKQEGAPTECSANQQFRTGASARLPDCRAYELVSPVNKEGGDIFAIRSINGYPAGLFQAASSGNGITYSSYRAFGDPDGAPYASQYLANRQSGTGWSTTPISPPREGPAFYNTAGLDSQYKAVTPDLCIGWFLQDAEPTLAAGAPPGFGDLYRRDNCGQAPLQALNTTEPTLTVSLNFLPVLQGYSADATCAVFGANDKLTPNASEETVTGAGIYQTYLACGSTLRLVSALPDGTASNVSSSAGTGNAGNVDRVSNVSQAVSSDGSRVYWTADESGTGSGKIYVRYNALQEQSAVVGGACTEPAKACTRPVSETVASTPARFWGANTSGSTAFFSVGGKLYLYDFGSGFPGQIAGQFEGWMGSAQDGSLVYFASREALVPGANSGDLNLYLYNRKVPFGEAFSLVAKLSELDVALGKLGPLSNRPDRRTSRISPDGGHAIFMSRSKALSELTAGYDNTDAVSGEPDAEVYRYDVAADDLVCVSCNPTGARPTGRELLMTGLPGGVWAAAQIQPWQNQLTPNRYLSDDGTRVYFESFEALDPRDTNRKQDVYQWEAAGKGDCDAADFNFVEASNGCVSLISSGDSPNDSRFVDSSSSGADVFIATSASLVAQDFGLIDIYDARIDGGLPAPPTPDPPCEGEACQSPPPPPDDPTPSSATFLGRGNLSAPASARRCSQGARAAKRLARRAKRQRRAAGRAENSQRQRRLNRRAARSAKRAVRLSGKAKRCRRSNRTRGSRR